MKRALLLLFPIATMGCGFHISKIPPADPGQSPATEATESRVDYGSIRKHVFQPRCVACHGTAGGRAAGVSLESYEETMEALEAIRSSVLIHKTMPPSGPLPQMEEQLLKSWIEQGAPRHVPNDEPKPDTPSSSPPLRPTWSAIRDPLFQTHCISCHSPARPRGRLDLTSLAITRRKAAAIFERVFLDRDMPPENTTILSDQEQRMLLDWLTGGMPEEIPEEAEETQ